MSTEISVETRSSLMVFECCFLFPPRALGGIGIKVQGTYLDLFNKHENSRNILFEVINVGGFDES